MKSTLLLATGLLFLLTACEKTQDIKTEDTEALSRRRPAPSSPPGPFYFNNCSHPSFSAQFIAGQPADVSVVLNYINSPGGNYSAYTSATVNGIKITTAAGTLNTGTGSITFTATGTPLNSGIISIPVSIAGCIACNLQITVLNAPLTGPCSDPGPTPGSTGCVTFTYRGQQVTYATVRANDGRIWLRQNLGSPQVPIHANDIGSFGHYFQWGRWDDGHQVPGSATTTGGPAFANPSLIAAGNPNFITGIAPSPAWWSVGASSNTWSGSTATATNGKDPCSALGAGWHLPSAAEWTSVMNAEFISDAVSAFDSRLKLTESGYRSAPDGKAVPNWVGGHYWTSTADNGNVAKSIFFDNAYNSFVNPMNRGYGAACRCVKN